MVTIKRPFAGKRLIIGQEFDFPIIRDQYANARRGIQDDVADYLTDRRDEGVVSIDVEGDNTLLLILQTNYVSQSEYNDIALEVIDRLVMSGGTGIRSADELDPEQFFRGRSVGDLLTLQRPFFTSNIVIQYDLENPSNITPDQMADIEDFVRKRTELVLDLTLSPGGRRVFALPRDDEVELETVNAVKSEIEEWTRQNEVSRTLIGVNGATV